eukprot:TRINITY_DN19770_c0_g1_i3.p1 TRINITY_DN19770_c0_g1~~TRINITY_DN19770_c0_g1_i3.p1  ORF type:complete len:609 (-),score=122.10 TRINITY_DN19770_c0_g1_i3:92-1918(-)
MGTRCGSPWWILSPAFRSWQPTRAQGQKDLPALAAVSTSLRSLPGKLPVVLAGFRLSCVHGRGLKPSYLLLWLQMSSQGKDRSRQSRKVSTRAGHAAWSRMDTSRPAPASNLTGAIALVARGECSFYKKVRNAQLAGARAVVVFSQDERPISMGCADPDPCNEVLDVAAVMIGRVAGEAMLEAMFATNISSTSKPLDLEAHVMGQMQGPQVVGLLGSQGGLWAGTGSSLSGLEEEVLGMEYQRRLLEHRKGLQAETSPDSGSDAAGLKDSAVTRIEVFQEQLLSGSLTAGWSSEQAALMRQNAYDELEIELHLDCEGHLDENCPAWDHELNLYLCSEGLTSHPTHCQDKAANIARWITPYGREGRWISNATAALPLLLAAETNRTSTLHITTWQKHVVTLVFWFRRSGASRGTPLARVQLWEGGKFDLGYNPAHEPLFFEVPPEASRATLSVLVTGHGWGVDNANCAEFCDHTHHFRLNGGEELVKAHAVAGSDDGCFKQVSTGVVPNQHGTWPFGRAGWCPGKYVDWWEVDVTPWLKASSGAMNNITYRALYEGSDYAPVEANNSNDMGFPAEIHLASFLTFYGEVTSSGGPVQLLQAQPKAPLLLL